jgi:hypothetical protein
MLKLAINTTACDGNNVFWPWFLWLLAAFLLGLLLGWLLHNLFGGSGSENDGARPDIGGSGLKTQAVSSFAAVDSVKDDLTKIEGIGPKIQGLLNADGIWSFNQLANAPKTRLQKILNDAGPAYTIHKPRTWSAQAKLADEGNWDDLEHWQNQLKGGL